MNRALIITFAMLFAQGCVTVGHKEFYTQIAPTKYPTTENVYVFEYTNVDLKEIYELLFSDFLVIGRSSFNGPYEPPSEAVSYAKSIGANVFLSTSQFQGTRTSFVPLTTPTVSTTSISGYSGSGVIYGTATTYGTKTSAIPIAVNRYDQNGMYLRNVNNVLPLWERTDSYYAKSEPSKFDGIWTNQHYTLNVYRSGQQVLGFVELPSKELTNWKNGQLKFIFGAESGVGVYLMGNKMPMPARVYVNKFGHLEVMLISSKETISFAR